MASAGLRCVNGSWICPTCFISCSTKGNLKRHMANVHRPEISDEFEESTDENSQSKFLVLDRNTADNSADIFDDNGQNQNRDSLDYADHDADVQIADTLTGEQSFNFEEINSAIADIETLYAKLSTDFIANRDKDPKKNSSVTIEESTSDQHDSDFSSDNESKGNESDESIIWSSDEEIEVSDSDENEEHRPIFEGSNITYEEHLMAVLSLAVRHNLNQTQLTDLIEVLKLHGPKDGIFVSSGQALFKEVTGDLDMQYHDVCEGCFRLFPEDPSVYWCATTGCERLRYRGKLCDQEKNRRKAYFVSVPLVEQFKDILERQHVWSNIQGQYHQRGKSPNVCDIIDGEEYMKHCQPGGILQNQNNISVLLNSDGIPIFQSSGIGVWPVQLVINEIPPKERFVKKNMVLWGIWQGKGKPPMHAFHRPLVLALNKLSNEGFTVSPPDYEQVCTLVFPLLTTMDLQGKGYWLNMVLHNGAFGCLDCYTKGYHVKSGKGYAHYYPYSEYKEAALRTSEQFKEDAVKAQQSNKTVNGIKGFSLVLAIQHHSVIPGYVIDYMHGALLGVTKTLLLLWFSASKQNKGKEFFIADQLPTVDKRLQRMQPPDFIVRLPRSLQANLHHLKASELKVWLLYYSLPILNGLLPKKYSQHYALFVEAIFILLGDSIAKEDLIVAEHFLDTFYKNFAKLYGESKCGLNVHNLVHYTNQVRAWGPLWCYSCFSFEDLNGDYVDSVHGTRNICHQIVRIFFSEKKLELKSISLKPDTEIQTFIQRMLSSGRRPKNVTEASQCWLVGKPVRFVPGEDVQVLLCTAGGDALRQHTFQKVLRIMLHYKVYFCEDYKRMSKRVSFAVMFQRDGDMAFGLIRHYLHDKDSGETYAVIDVPKTTDAPDTLTKLSLHHIWLSKERDFVTVVNVAKIQEKVFYLTGNRKNICISRAPNFVERE